MEQTVSQPAIQGAHPLSDRLKSTSLPMTTRCTLRHQHGTLLSEDHHLLVIQLHNSHLMLCTRCSPNTEDLARHSKGGLVEKQLSTTFENRCLARQPFQSVSFSAHLSAQQQSRLLPLPSSRKRAGHRQLPQSPLRRGRNVVLCLSLTPLVNVL